MAPIGTQPADSRAVFDNVFGEERFECFEAFTKTLLEYSRISGRAFVVHNSKKVLKRKRNVGGRTKKGETRETFVVNVKPTAEARYVWVNYRCQHHGRGDRHEGRTTR